MKGDLPEICLRLSTSLPSRVHYAKVAEEIVQRQVRKVSSYQKRTELRQGKSSPVQVGGLTYDSLSQAVRCLRISPTKMYALIDSGRASFLSTGTRRGSEKSTRKA